jgi:hypothetical protein
MKFLVPNYSCLQNPWLGGYRTQIPILSSVFNWICWTPHPEQNSWVRHCILPHYVINGVVLEKPLVNIKPFVSSYPTFVWNFFHSKKNWARYDHKCILVFKWSNRHSWRFRWSRGCVLTSSTQVRGYKPGRSRQDFSGRKNISNTPSFGG